MRQEDDNSIDGPDHEHATCALLRTNRNKNTHNLKSYLLVAKAFGWFLPFACILSSSTTHAGERRFTYVYEATTAAPGSLESENIVTWQTHKTSIHGFQEVDVRNEIEFGVTEHFQIGVYLADWNYLNDPAEQKHGFNYQSSAVELIYNLTNPTTDWVGSAVYGELTGGNNLLELEGKIILQKNIGQFEMAYNASLEGSWSGHDLNENEGEFSQTAGISYEITPRFTVGVEVIHEIAIPDWSHAERSVVWGGPNISCRFDKFWFTVTPVIQMTRSSEEPDFQLRTIFGFTF